MKYSVWVHAEWSRGDGRSGGVVSHGPAPHNSAKEGRSIAVDSAKEAKRVALAMYEHGKKLAAKKK